MFLNLFSGYREIVRILLHEFRKIRVDHKNKAGFTALMKAALQGRTSCAKLLLYAGTSTTPPHPTQINVNYRFKYCYKMYISRYRYTKYVI